MILGDRAHHIFVRKAVVKGGGGPLTSFRAVENGRVTILKEQEAR